MMGVFSSPNAKMTPHIHAYVQTNIIYSEISMHRK